MGKGGGFALPPYPLQHSGPVLVCGSAKCLHDDLAAAREIYPVAPAIAVNGASREIKALALYSIHADRFIEKHWIYLQAHRYGNGFSVHSTNVEKMGRLPHVDYWWEDARGGGGSAWGARKVAWLMGFDPVVLCGCPLERGPYVGDHNLGGFMHLEDVVESMRAGISAEPEWHEGVFSMSGWTRELLGLPPTAG